MLRDLRKSSTKVSCFVVFCFSFATMMHGDDGMMAVMMVIMMVLITMMV